MEFLSRTSIASSGESAQPPKVEECCESYRAATSIERCPKAGSQKRCRHVRKVELDAACAGHAGGIRKNLEVIFETIKRDGDIS